MKGPKHGKVDIFLSGLPGMPDNIRKSESGYYISLVTTKKPNEFDLVDGLSGMTGLRKVLMRSLTLTSMGLDFINSVSPCPTVEEVKEKVLYL